MDTTNHFVQNPGHYSNLTHCSRSWSKLHITGPDECNTQTQELDSSYRRYYLKWDNSLLPMHIVYVFLDGLVYQSSKQVTRWFPSVLTHAIHTYIVDELGRGRTVSLAVHARQS